MSKWVNWVNSHSRKERNYVYNYQSALLASFGVALWVQIINVFRDVITNPNNLTLFYFNLISVLVIIILIISTSHYSKKLGGLKFNHKTYPK